MAAQSQLSSKPDFDKVWLMFQETDKKFKETDKKLNKLEHLFTSQWGKLVESLVEGNLINMLNKRGIKVHQTATRVRGFHKNRQYEFDIIAEIGIEVVIVEVKTTLRPDDISEFLDELSEVKSVLPKYKTNKIYGAVAYITEDGGSAKMASRKGLFTIKATGKSASITNIKSFKPKEY